MENIENKKSKSKIGTMACSDLGKARPSRSVGSLADRYINFLESGKHSDTTLILGKGKVPIKAHKSFLIFGSAYFEEQLTGNFADSSVGVGVKAEVVGVDGDDHKEGITSKSTELKIENDNNALVLVIDDVEPDDFRLFLKFIYNAGFSEIPVEEAMPLLACGKKFKVPILVKTCEKVLKTTITMDSALTLFEQALRYKSSDLLKSAAGFISANAYKMVCRREFTELSQEAVQLIVENDATQVYDEMQLFEAIIAWAKSECVRQKMDSNNPKYMRSVLEPLLNFIRFPQMMASEFALKVPRLKLLTSDELVDVLQYFHVPQAQRAFMPSQFFISTARNYHKPDPTVHMVKRLETGPATKVNPGLPCDLISQIRFKANKCVWISSIGICPPASATNLQLKVKVEIRHAEDENMCYGKAKKDVFPVDNVCDHVEFKQPVRITADVWYIAFMSIEILKGPYQTYSHPYASNGPIECDTGVTFEFLNGDVGPKQGEQIPEIKYQLDE